MSLNDVFLSALVAIVCGTVAQLTSGYSRGGWIVNIGLGCLGSLTGAVLSRTLNAPLIYNLKIYGADFPIIYAVVGSVFFLASIGFFLKPGRG